MCTGCRVRMMGIVLVAALLGVLCMHAARRAPDRVRRGARRAGITNVRTGRATHRPSRERANHARFRSSLPLRVFSVPANANYPEDCLGTTPSEQGIEVRGVWSVEARESVSLRDLVAALCGTGVRGLSLDGCVFETADLALLSELPNLEWLDCAGRDVGGAGLAHIGRLAGLRYIGLHSVPLDDAGVAQLGGLTALETIDLTKTPVGDEAMRHLATLPRLECVLLSDVTLSASGFRHLVGAPKLRALELGGASTDSSALIGLSGHATLETLKFRYQKDFTPETLGYVRRLPALRALEFWACEQITDKKDGGFNEQGLEQIGRIAGLRSLALCQAQRGDKGLARLGDKGLARLVHLKDLERLKIYQSKITDTGMAHLRHFPRLTELSLWEADISDVGMKICRELPDLVKFELGGARRVTDAGLNHLSADLESLTLHGGGIRQPNLSRFRALRRLWLTELEDAGLASIAHLPALVHVDIAGTQVTSAGLRHLRRLRTLRELDLTHTLVDDAGLAHLASLVNLEWLKLEGTALTGTGLRRLAGLSSLRQLDLSGTKVTDGSLAGLPPNLETLILSDTPITGRALPHVGRLKHLTRLQVFDTAFPRTRRIGSCEVECESLD